MWIRSRVHKEAPIVSGPPGTVMLCTALYTMDMPVVDQAKQLTLTTVPQPEYDKKRLYTVDEAYRIAELFPGERWELIEGEIISKMGQKPPHAHIIRRLSALLSGVFGPGKVQCQLPVRLPEPYSEPEPDVVLFNKDSEAFAHQHPSPADVAILFEVADTTFQADREIKYRLYARAGVAEYWIIDIQNRRTFVCREPAGDEYKSIALFQVHEPVTSPAAPGFSLLLKDLFPQG